MGGDLDRRKRISCTKAERIQDASWNWFLLTHNRLDRSVRGNNCFFVIIRMPDSFEPRFRIASFENRVLLYRSQIRHGSAKTGRSLLSTLVERLRQKNCSENLAGLFLRFIDFVVKAALFYQVFFECPLIKCVSNFSYCFIFRGSQVSIWFLIVSEINLII